MAGVEQVPGLRPSVNLISASATLFIFNLAVAAIPFMVAQIASLMSSADLLIMSSSTNSSSGSQDQTYDFIVVGGGSAGSPVAGRLSRDYKVLLIEAGGNPHPLSYIPFATAGLLNQPSIDWKYKTEPLTHCGFGLVDQKSTWPRGKSVGGSSNTNFMIYMRGNPNDFNRWAEHTQDPRWKYENVENVFKRMEDYHGHWEDSKYHGVGGPMHIERVGYEQTTDYWLDAGRELGFKSSDPNAYQFEGLHPVDVTMKRGTRFSTYRGYILPNRKNPNLIVHKYSHATKIHFDEDLRAVGVTYFRHGVQFYAKASKEIIISSGSINSPKLLMLSGIGPKEHLDTIGIKTLVNLPVGENMSDHVSTVLGPFLLNQQISTIYPRDLTLKSVAASLFSGNGILSSPLGVEGIGLLASKKATPAWPDIFFFMQNVGIYETLGQELSKAFGLREEIFANFLNYNANNDTNLVVISNGLPKSRGYIKLRDADPFSDPLIDPNYYSDEKGEDIQVMLEGIEKVLKIFENTTSYGKLGARLAPNSLPGCESFEFRSRAYWECFVRSIPLTVYHPCGTCSMGKKDDASAVVDSQLRVIGTKGLRVADASVMPFITNANLNAPTIMIGEMCAELVQETWKDPSSGRS